MKKLHFIFFCSLFTVHFSLAQQYGWIDLSANVPDSVNYIRDVYFIGQEGWITGGYNSEVTIYYSSNGGLSFIKQNVPDNSGNNALSIFMRTPQEGYAVSNTGQILRTTDGGNNWITIATGLGLLYSVSFPPFPEPTGYSCGDHGKIHSINGSTVSLQNSGISSATLFSISFPLNSNEGWVCGGGIIRHRTAAGWQDDQNYNGSKWYNAISFFDDQHGWAVGVNGIIIRTLNGTDWVTQNNPDNNQLIDVCFVNTQEGWAAGSNVILHTIDGGVTWVKESQALTDSTLINSVFALNSHEVYVAGQKYGENFHNPLLLKYTEITSTKEQHKPGIILYQNKPNPFSQSTVISWQIPVGSWQLAPGCKVTLKVFDFLGKEVKTLVEADLAPGEHQATFDASDLPAGVYFYQLKANGIIETKKMICYR